MFATTAIEKNVKQLCRLLAKEKNLFEQVAGQAADHALRVSILSVAQQNNQYAIELSSHIVTATEPPSAGKASGRKSKQVRNQPAFDNDSKLLSFCSSSENKIVVAYRYILRHTTLYEGLEKMIRYQLKGVQNAAGQLELLSSVKTV